MKISASLLVLLFVLCFLLVSIFFSSMLVTVDASSSGWSRTYVLGQGRSVIQTDDGGYAIAGNAQPWSSPREGEGGFLLIKTDSVGDVEWEKNYGSGAAYAVIQVSDGGYVLTGSGTLFNIVKTDLQGNMQWNKLYTFQPFSIIQAADGGYVMAGYGESSGGGYDVWLVKTDAEGIMQWHKTYEPFSCDLYLYEWLAPYPILETEDGGFVIVSSTSAFGAGDVDAWLIKTDVEGNVQWNRTYGGSGEEYASFVARTSDGGYLLAGWTESFGAGGRDSWLVKTDFQGNIQWNRTYGVEPYDYFYSVVQTPDGGYLGTKCVQSSVGSWFFSAEVVKLYASGDVEFTINYPSTSDMMRMDARFILGTDDGGYIFTGHQTTADDPHISREHVWLVKIDPSEIPEFPSWTILPLFLIASIIVIVCKKKLTKT